MVVMLRVMASRPVRGLVQPTVAEIRLGVHPHLGALVADSIQMEVGLQESEYETLENSHWLV